MFDHDADLLLVLSIIDRQKNLNIDRMVVDMRYQRPRK